MRLFAAAVALAALLPNSAVAQEEQTYNIRLSFSGVWGKSWVESIEAALGRLEGVKYAKTDGSKTDYLVKILETKSVLPAAIRKIVDEKFEMDSVSYEVAGTVEKTDKGYVFTGRANKQQFTVKENDDLKKLVADGKTKLTLTGAVTEPEEKEGKKPLPVIEVTEAKETKK